MVLNYVSRAIILQVATHDSFTFVVIDRILESMYSLFLLVFWLDSVTFFINQISLFLFIFFLMRIWKLLILSSTLDSTCVFQLMASFSLHILPNGEIFSFVIKFSRTCYPSIKVFCEMVKKSPKSDKIFIIPFMRDPSTCEREHVIDPTHRIKSKLILKCGLSFSFLKYVVKPYV